MTTGTGIAIAGVALALAMAFGWLVMLAAIGQANKQQQRGAATLTRAMRDRRPGQAGAEPAPLDS